MATKVMGQYQGQPIGVKDERPSYQPPSRERMRKKVLTTVSESSKKHNMEKYPKSKTYGPSRLAATGSTSKKGIPKWLAVL